MFKTSGFHVKDPPQMNRYLATYLSENICDISAPSRGPPGVLGPHFENHCSKPYMVERVYHGS